MNHVPEAPTVRRRVLVVDADRMFAQLLVHALRTEVQLEGVGHAQTPEQARRQVELLRPDVVVTDLRLGEGEEGTVALLRHLCTAHPGVLVVLLAAFPGRELVRRAGDLGVAAMVPKGAELSELLDVLRSVRRGGLVLHASLLTSLLPASQRRRGGPATALTSREQQVLGLLAQGLGPAAIARELGITLNTCRGYIKTLLAKFHAHTQLGAVVAAARQGLIPARALTPDVGEAHVASERLAGR